ncbi:MAG: hypothetical protein B1H05_01335 [Candidatus Cloacimonas sp. 4484_140]|nr:MAG: hypothetical protein B1H05_01335 [Candidatus Cloacimonas sp. 4484_140]
MKKFIIVLFLSVLLISIAQADSLFSSGSISGVFGGPLVKYTKINNKDALILGARGGWAFNSIFTIGGGAYGLVNDIPINAAQPDTNFINLGYGGIVVEYVGMSDNVIHWQVGGLIGTGAVSTRNGNETGKNDIIFVLEPGADAVLNITSTIRLSAGISYRFVSGVDSDNFDYYLKNSDLSNFSASLTLLFGSF